MAVVFAKRAAFAALFFSLGMVSTAPVPAAEWRVSVNDGQGPVANAVVSLHADATPATGARAVMDQRNSSFEPSVLAVQVGTLVSFPNSDKVQHQVYSFSRPKPFELPLYAGTPLAPVLFDRPGVVVVGCNIHDWMIGYIVVLDTAYFGKTDATGQLVLAAPAGEYRMHVWHSRQKVDVPEQLVVVGTMDTTQQVRLDLGPEPPQRQGNDRLRALQEKLRGIKRDP